MAKKVTLYIEDTEIKLLVTKGMQVEEWASLLLEPKLVSDGVIVDEDQVAESIKKLYKLGGVSAKKVIAGLSGLNSIFRVITLPELSPALLPEAVMNEARRVIPLPLEQVYLSHQPIPSPKGETRLFLVAYPRNSTDTLLRTLRKAGLKPDVMDLAPLALARCANAPEAIIINSWLTYLDIVIITDRMPQVIRSLSLPTEAVSIEEKLPVIAEELARTVAFYNSSNPGKPLDSSVPVFVCGDLAEVSDSWPSLVGKAGYPVSELLPPIQFPETFSTGKFMVNIGLAIKGQLPGGEENYYSIVDFNALPGAYQPPGISLTRIFVPVAIAVGIGALVYGGLFVWDFSKETDKLLSPLDTLYMQADILRSKADDLRSEADDLRSQADTLQSQLVTNDDDITAQYEEIAMQEEKISQQQEANLQPIEAELMASDIEAKLDSLEQGLDKTDKDLQEAIDLVPEAVTLLDIDYDSESATIYGLAITEDDIFIYARELRSSGRFTEVTILSIIEILEKEAEEEIRFFSFEFLLK